MFLGLDEIAGGVPAGAVEQQDGVGVSGDVQGYLVEMQLHGVGVGEGQRQPCAHAPRRTDGAKEIGALVALVRGLERPRSPPGVFSKVFSRGRPNQISIFRLARNTRPRCAASVLPKFF